MTASFAIGILLPLYKRQSGSSKIQACRASVYLNHDAVNAKLFHECWRNIGNGFPGRKPITMGRLAGTYIKSVSGKD
jgi:hypothetical protein